LAHAGSVDNLQPVTDVEGVLDDLLSSLPRPQRTRDLHRTGTCGNDRADRIVGERIVIVVERDRFAIACLVSAATGEVSSNQDAILLTQQVREERSAPAGRRVAGQSKRCRAVGNVLAEVESRRSANYGGNRTRAARRIVALAGKKAIAPDHGILQGEGILQVP